MLSWLYNIWSREESNAHNKFNSFYNDNYPPPSSFLRPTSRINDPVALQEIEETRELLRQVRETIKKELGSLQMQEIPRTSSSLDFGNSFHEEVKSVRLQLPEVTVPVVSYLTPVQNWAEMKKQHKKLLSKKRKMGTITSLNREQKEVEVNGMKLNTMTNLWEKIDLADVDPTVRDLDNLGWDTDMKQVPDGWKSSHTHFVVNDKLHQQWMKAHENHLKLGGWLSKETNCDNRSFLDNARRLAIKKLITDASHYGRGLVETDGFYNSNTGVSSKRGVPQRGSDGGKVVKLTNTNWTLDNKNELAGKLMKLDINLESIPDSTLSKIPKSDHFKIEVHQPEVILTREDSSNNVRGKPDDYLNLWVDDNEDSFEDIVDDLQEKLVTKEESGMKKAPITNWSSWPESNNDFTQLRKSANDVTYDVDDEDWVDSDDEGHISLEVRSPIKPDDSLLKWADEEEELYSDIDFESSKFPTVTKTIGKNSFHKLESSVVENSQLDKREDIGNPGIEEEDIWDEYTDVPVTEGLFTLNFAKEH